MLTHSNRRPRSALRRFAYPSLAAVGVIGLACGAKPLGAPVLDANKDGIADALGPNVRFVDSNGDGVIDANDVIDLNGDGIPDGRALDTDGDGEADAAGKDTNGDGVIDAIDRDGDGKPEEQVDDNGGTGGNVSVDGNPGAGGSGAGTSDDEDFDDLVVASGGKGMYVPPEEGEFCDSVTVDFVPKTPTVYVLVDRSTSMWDSSTPPYWDTLRSAVLPVIQELQGDVRMGFGTFTGTPNQCTGLTEGAPVALSNYAAIESAYSALARPSDKSDTPTAQAITQVTDLLLADESPGDRFILLITDGNPDFCGDPEAKCGADALIASLQLSAARGVKTLVFGIENKDITVDWFDYYAQAGWGELPSWPDGLDVGRYTGHLESRCKQYADWSALRTQTGNDPDPEICPTQPEEPLNCFLPAGDYSTTPGKRTAFLNTNIQELGAQIKTNLESLKSCVFDLSQSNVEVKEDQVSTGQIFVDEVLIPSDQWRMNDRTTLELLGASCETWLQPEVTKFFAGFPCDALIIK